jgi:hypothetical protein
VAFNRKQFGPGQPENPDQGKHHVGTDGIRVTLEQDFRDEELQHFFSFAINATRGIDPENPPEPVDWEEMMRGGLQTALKRINIAFAVYGASRTATHQLVRSHAGQLPPAVAAGALLRRPPKRADAGVVAGQGHRQGGRHRRRGHAGLADHFHDLVEHAAQVYRLATDLGVSYQDARFALLEGTTNFILCEYSLDEFINVYAYRALQHVPVGDRLHRARDAPGASGAAPVAGAVHQDQLREDERREGHAQPGRRGDVRAHVHVPGLGGS